MVHGGRDNMKLAHSSEQYGYISMVNRPPKPPCWRDFLPDQRPRTAKDTSPLHFSDLSQISQKATKSTDQLTLFGLTAATSSVPTHAHTAVPGSSYGRSQSVKCQKKHGRNKLHRTRSEVTIEQQQIPDMSKTLTLAETKPREFGLRKTHFDPHVYIEENTRRCERWLEGVRNSRPLEDVHFAQGTGVELEIPDEESLVCGHASDPDVDSVSIISVAYLRETQSLPRSLRGRHKLKSPLSVGEIKLENVENKPSTSEVKQEQDINLSQEPDSLLSSTLNDQCDRTVVPDQDNGNDNSINDSNVVTSEYIEKR